MQKYRGIGDIVNIKEVNLEAPENIADEIASVIVTAMKSAGVYFCPNAPLDATCDIGDFWIHE